MRRRRSWMFKMKLEKIKAIIFNEIEKSGFDGERMSFYSERVLNLASAYKLAIISEEVPGIAEIRFLQVNGKIKYFDTLSVNETKNGEQYVECIKKLNVKPENILIVDDELDRGIKIGNELGCQTYWINDERDAHKTLNQETGQPSVCTRYYPESKFKKFECGREPTKIINSIKDLVNILENDETKN